ncbi:hypothetical protein Hanom_Chr12g01108291 [Helianthus anomalus]
MDLPRNANVQELRTHLTNLLKQLEHEKKVCEEIHKIRIENQKNNWWDKPIEDLGLADLEKLKVAMLELKEVVQKEVERRTT